MNINDTVINRLIPMIYEGVLDPGIRDAMALELCSLLGVIGVHGFVRSKENGRTLFGLAQSSEGANVDSATRQYEEHFHALDPLIPLTRGTKAWITDDAIPTSLIERSEFYQDFLIPSGSGRRMSSCLHESESLWFGLGFHRRRIQPPFGAPEHQLLNQLAPHLRSAGLIVAAHQNLIDQLNLCRTSLDAFEDALIWMAPGGRIRNMNSAGDDLLRKGTHLSALFGKLQVKSSLHDQGFLFASIKQVAKSGVSTMVQIGATGEQTMTVRLFPMSMDSQVSGGANEGVVLLSIKPTRPQGNRLVPLQQIFGLSLAEGRLVIALLEGASLAEYAASRGLGMPTVRTQIKQVFAKTRTHRQAELVALLGKIM